MRIPKQHKLAFFAALVISGHASGAVARDRDLHPTAFPGTGSNMQSGVAARAEIVIPFSSDSTLRREDGWRLQLAAGPQLSWTSLNNDRRQRFSPLLAFSLKPQHSNTLSVAGYSVFTSWDRSVSAAERTEEEQREGRSVAKWGGIVLGAAAVVGGIVLLSGSGSSDDCEPEVGGPVCLPEPR